MRPFITKVCPMVDLHQDPQRIPQVFVSYASTDRLSAEIIVAGLRSQGLTVASKVHSLHPENHIADSIRSAVSANAYFLLLLSRQSVNSRWSGDESVEILKELQSRNITFLPVLLDDCEIPASVAMYQCFDMKTGIEQNLERLIEALKSTSSIDFQKLSPQMFDHLIADLLSKLGFVDRKVEMMQASAPRADAIVEFRHKDPFGAETREIYIVEVKLYPNSRADLRSLRQLALIAEHYPEADKALLVTNGNLTSVALDWVHDSPKAVGVPIRVIDGTELKRLLLQNTDLVSKYFSNHLSTAA
jgi:TIR domain/Restriction endonuclease